MNTPTDRPLDSFETALLTELRETVAQRGATPARRRTRSVAAVAAAGIAALATGIGLTTMGGSPAFAVETAADGDIVVRIHELTDADGLERALADQGVTAEVQYAGEAGEVITLDEDGNVTSGQAPPGEDLTNQGEHSESGTQAGGEGAMSSTGPGLANDGPCGDTASLPVTVARDGDDFVITIEGDSQIAKEHLTIATLSRGEGADIIVSFSPQEGTMCGIGTTTD